MSIANPSPLLRSTEQDKLSKEISQNFWTKYAFLILVGLTLLIDFFSPYLVRRRLLPNSVRFVSDAAILGLFVLLLFRSIVFDKIPVSLFLIAGITLIWGIVATYEGQDPLATFWGWWRLFKFPIIGVITYLQPFWPENFSEKLRKGCFALLTLNVALQGYQYATGEIPGDHLSGFFGRFGVSPLLLFIIFNLCLAFGRWLALNKWDMLLIVLPLSGIASGLGEMKLFPFLLVAVGTFTFILQLLRGRHYQQLFFYAVFLTLFVFAFGMFYNTVVSEARGTRRIEEYLNADTLDSYLNRAYRRDNGTYYLGRGFALRLGWQTIQRDGTTLLFGMGLGSRGESVTLGVAGSGLTEGLYGLVSGTSLLVLMQEIGIVGLVVFGGVALWIVITLWIAVIRRPDSPHTTLRLALILQTILWPLLIWYSQTWTFGVFMLLYWGSVGYLLGYARDK